VQKRKEKETFLLKKNQQKKLIKIFISVAFNFKLRESDTSSCHLISFLDFPDFSTDLQAEVPSCKRESRTKIDPH